MTTSLAALRAHVQAARQEFDLAISFHEAWRPTAYDLDLQARMGTSFATHTFRVIRQALRREMLLALTRLWDRDHRATGMEAISDALQKQDVVKLLEDMRRANLTTAPADIPDVDPEFRDDALAIFKRMDAEQAEVNVSALHQQIVYVRARIADYRVGGVKHQILKHVRTLRNERLAHRQIEASPPEKLQGSDADIEGFYLDMQSIIADLVGIFEYTHFIISETSKAHGEAAALFWATVRGERTEGHPQYRPSRPV